MSIVTSAPGKVILFGEHAVVYGEPALSAAISLRIFNKISIEEHPSEKEIRNPYLREIAKMYNVQVHTKTWGSLPIASGLGSSAAYTVSTIAGLDFIMHNKLDIMKIAKTAFEVEYNAQGRASPNDTSVATLGGYIILSRKVHDGFLWKIEKDNVFWNVHRVPLDPLDIVIVYTGKPSKTGEMVTMVKRLYEKNEEIRAAIRRIGEIVLEAIDLIKSNDIESLGSKMYENHELLRKLCVSNEELDRIVKVLSRYCYGAKITGAGGGGSVIGLLKENSSKKVIEAFKETPYKIYIVKTGSEGVRVEKPYNQTRR
ncbi:MAG: mevalonate kinase [Euryarchaeota archaeon]|nr:mevalonate kinase [Euryarchaeota archaeon]